MKVTIGTPMYGGQCTGAYTVSIINLISELGKRGHSTSTSFIYNESLIQRARNNIATNFLNSDSDILLFIDSDIEFDANQIADMIELDLDVVGAVYPMKGINWGNVIGLITKTQPPYAIEAHSGYHNVNYYKTEQAQQNILEGKPFEVERIGTGMLAIKKQVFEKMIPHTQSYTNDDPTHGPQKRYNFFPVCVQEDRLMSEDFMFCNNWKKLGGKIFGVAYPLLRHYGTYAYSGNLMIEKLTESKL